MSQNRKSHRKGGQGVILKIRDSRTFKGIAVCLSLNLLAQMIQPSMSLALTSGPTQPEVQSFEPIGTTQMVDPFTGDFNYNIPLFNLPGPNGGYPVNLAYHAGISMDDEASWVGLGWNINAGALVRNMRGLPDEFLSVADMSNMENIAPKDNEDHIEVKKDMKQSWTLGINGSISNELFGAKFLPSAGLSASLYYNSYRGLGVTLEPTIGIGNNKNFNLGFSIDSESGLGVSASISMEGENEHKTNRHKFSLDFNGDLSVGYGLSVSTKAHDVTKTTSVENSSGSYSSSMSFARSSFSPTIGNKKVNRNISGSLAIGTSTVPFATSKWSTGFSFTTEDYSDEDKNGRRIFVAGYDQQGNDLANYYTKDFTRANDGQITKNSAFLGNTYSTYDTYQSTGQGLAGFFRARRNDIGRHNDPYQRNGSAGFNIGLELAIPAGIASAQWDVESVGANGGWSTQGAWDNDIIFNTNPLNDDYLATNTDGIEENLYYQAHGESTIMLDSDLSYLGGLALAKVTLHDKGSDGLEAGRRKVSTNVSFDNDGHNKDDRFVRNTLITDLKNMEVDHLGEYDISYFSTTDDINYPFGEPLNPLDRSTRNGVNINNHKAGFKVLNGEGSHYVYALPAYNNTEVENTFSVVEESPKKTVQYPMNGTDEVDYKVSGSHKYINKTTKTPYAHSFLLTSIQGADYIDVTNDGPSDDDLGYWVKFDYVKTSDDYQWRSPYTSNDAHYNPGAAYTGDDDMASYRYGEKEVWYMGRMETKSHIAIFVLGDRTDNLEAAGEYHTSTANGDRGKKLERIDIYEKKNFSANATPLQSVHFKYDQSTTPNLCAGGPNAPGGKLTLKALYFTSQGSSRGAESKYEFDYAAMDLVPSGESDGENPLYNENSYDAWGVYKDVDGTVTDYDFYSHFPYTEQFNQEWNDADYYPSTVENDLSRAITQERRDNFASAWCLDEIKLPSGGTINIDYESDDYGYVQHKTANQMFKIAFMGDEDSQLQDDELYKSNKVADEYYDSQSRADDMRRRVYFKLEYPFLGTEDADAMAQEIYEKYVEPMMTDEDGNKNLYFKSKMVLIDNGGAPQDVEDYISGYLPLEKPRYDAISTSVKDDYNYGISSDGVNGFVTIKPTRKKNNDSNDNPQYFDEYHPMSMVAWTYLQTNAQELLNNPNSFNGAVDEDNFLGKVGGMLNVVPQLMSSFGAIRTYCQSKGFARYIDLDKSCIRMASPDKRKFGGGHRVKQISMTDNWNADTQEADRTYGQVYDYTIIENGQVISSGVAQYEPQAGGDENALKYPLHYWGKSTVFTKNNLFAEAPYNEALFPGAQVGYRKIAVKSINTETQIKNKVDQTNPVGRTGGVAVHEFYTAKEFPTIVSNTILSKGLNTKDHFNLPIIIPFVGSIKRNYYHGTQAYMIETNDMHGKPKSVKTYEVSDYEVGNNPITESTTEYQSLPISYQGENVRKLDNYVDVVPNNGTHEVSSVKRLMGVEVDLYTDQRESKNFSSSIGLSLGVEVPTFIPWPFPEVWVTLSNHKSMFRTFVTNKVVHRSGILKRTVTRDLQTSNESEVLAYDEKSGTPLLTKMTNEFGDDFYNYNIPAYYHYEEMGHAYQNINFNFWGDVTLEKDNSNGDNGGEFIHCYNQDAIDHLVAGDEVLIVGASGYSNGSSSVSPLAQGYKRGYFLGFEYTGQGKVDGIFHFPDGIAISDFASFSGSGGTVTDVEDAFLKMKVIRSGRRNHFGTMAASYLTRRDQAGELKFVDPSDPIYEEITDLGLVDSYQNTTKNLDSKSVLSASSSLFKDNWSNSDLIGQGRVKQDILFGNTEIDNPYLTGNSGIWRPYKSYSYVGKRATNASMVDNKLVNENPDLRNDGMFDEPVPMFSYDLGNMEEYVSNWEWVNEVTRFSKDSYETENVNRLGIHSAALYGYDNSLSIAVGGNASYFELGAVDFETATANYLHGESMLHTNMNFHNNGSAAIAAFFMSDVMEIQRATYSTTGTPVLTVKTKVPFAVFSATSTNYDETVGLTLNQARNSNDGGNNNYYLNGTADFANASSYLATNGIAYTKFDVEPYIDEDNPLQQILPSTSTYTGKVRVLIERNVSAESVTGTDVLFASDKAHTGKKSMKVNSTVSFQQPKLKLIANKKYILSMWVSRDDAKVVTFDPASLISLGTNTVGASITVNETTTSKTIEGWQKLELEFETSQEDVILAIQIVPGVEALYIDDIRYSPKTGGITTYVYDPDNFWLRASLNVDNYATLFFYDEEGNLTIKKQETEEGVFTITESRGHVSEN